ncbi:MAG TPA: hypothetical protein K8V35_02670 [Aliicoccus persicus]|uniref:Uncharacterized protein n=1 Tax=Aliicoccus persicus TaxID=930138 RepID=A0A921B654_9STAP|nr:hypothetical protein [Aliicoccus persicus]
MGENVIPESPEQVRALKAKGFEVCDICGGMYEPANGYNVCPNCEAAQKED